MTITGPRKKDPSYTLRRVFVHSSANAAAARRARARKLEQAAGELDRLTRGLGSRHYPDAAKVTARVSAIAAARRVADYLRANAGTGPDGRPTLDWRFDQAADRRRSRHRRLVRAADQPRPGDVTAAAVLARYKNQPAASERRYHDLKGPLAVAPMFLHSNRRITAIIGVICMALLIYCLVERQARRNLAPAAQARRPLRRPPGQAHRQPDLHHPGHPAPACRRQRRAATDTQPDLVQQRLLDLLEIDPRKLADPPAPHVRITGLDPFSA